MRDPDSVSGAFRDGGQEDRGSALPERPDPTVPMEYEEFQEFAHDAFQRIPEEYRRGVDGLTVAREAMPHPTLPDIYTLGHCLSEAYPSDWTGPETLRSIVVLYWGSFRRISRMDPSFDWEDEIWETLTHELRHHLEYLAEEDELGGVDYALDEGFKRGQGMDFDPWYYQMGEEVDEGVFQVEYDFYLEQSWTEEAFQEVRRITFWWHGEEYRIPRPGALGDVHFIWIDGIELGAARLQVVLLRKRSWWETLKRFFRREQAVVYESEAWAEPVP